jgi:vacuolar protein sorting-associated protein 33A
MAPHVGFDTEQIRDKARKDILYLLEGVSQPSYLALSAIPYIRPFSE